MINNYVTIDFWNKNNNNGIRDYIYLFFFKVIS